MSQDEENPFFDLDGDATIPSAPEAWAELQHQAGALAVLQRLIDAGMEIEIYPNRARDHMAGKEVTAVAFKEVRTGNGPADIEMQNRGRGEGRTAADALLKLGEWVRMA